MVGVFHTAFLTTSLFVSSLLPQASTSAGLSPLPVIGQESFHAVNSGETLTQIAKEEYEDESRVDLILQDNDWITDPNLIQEGWMIKIRKNPLLDTPDVVVQNVKSDESIPHVEEIPSLITPTPLKQEVQSIIVTEAPSPTRTTQLPAPTYAGGPLNEEQLNFLGNCESGMTATRNSGNGFYGAFQFSIGTWNAMSTGYERADLAPLDVQKDAVQRLLSRSSIFTQFPGCSRKMQAIGLI